LARSMAKRSVTLDPEVAAAVDHHVAAGAAASFSAAVNEAAARWAANQDLREALDAVYEATPEARPTDDEIATAAGRLKSARENTA
jgi:Arc/MetJ-type ribon-helix-helix transcriptional regulator